MLFTSQRGAKKEMPIEPDDAKRSALYLIPTGNAAVASSFAQPVGKACARFRLAFQGDKNHDHFPCWGFTDDLWLARNAG